MILPYRLKKEIKLKESLFVFKKMSEWENSEEDAGHVMDKEIDEDVSRR